MMKSILFCFDFDLTITTHHLFTSTAQKMALGFSREDACIQSIKEMRSQGIRNEERLWTLILRLLTHNHGIAVTTFTAFPELPLSFLNEGIRRARRAHCTSIQTRWLSRGCVVYGDPAPHLCPSDIPPNCIYIPRHLGGDGSQGKNPHLQKALEWANQRSSQLFTRCVLIDDDPRNVELALNAGYDAIWVNPDPENVDYLNELETLLDCLEKE